MQLSHSILNRSTGQFYQKQPCAISCWKKQQPVNLQIGTCLALCLRRADKTDDCWTSRVLRRARKRSNLWRSYKRPGDGWVPFVTSHRPEFHKDGLKHVLPKKKKKVERAKEGTAGLFSFIVLRQSAGTICITMQSFNSINC